MVCVKESVNVFNTIIRSFNTFFTAELLAQETQRLLDIEQKDKEVIVSYYNKEGTVSFKRYAVDKFQNWVVAKMIPSMIKAFDKFGYDWKDKDSEFNFIVSFTIISIKIIIIPPFDAVIFDTAS